MTSIFEGQPPKTRPFRIKTRVIWVPGTLPETNIFAPEKWMVGVRSFPFGMAYFQVLLLLCAGSVHLFL